MTDNKTYIHLQNVLVLVSIQIFNRGTIQQHHLNVTFGSQPSHFVQIDTIGSNTHYHTLGKSAPLAQQKASWLQVELYLANTNVLESSLYPTQHYISLMRHHIPASISLSAFPPSKSPPLTPQTILHLYVICLLVIDLLMLRALLFVQLQTIRSSLCQPPNGCYVSLTEQPVKSLYTKQQIFLKYRIL